MLHVDLDDSDIEEISVESSVNESVSPDRSWAHIKHDESSVVPESDEEESKIKKVHDVDDYIVIPDSFEDSAGLRKFQKLEDSYSISDSYEEKPETSNYRFHNTSDSDSYEDASESHNVHKFERSSFSSDISSEKLNLQKIHKFENTSFNIEPLKQSQDSNVVSSGIIPQPDLKVMQEQLLVHYTTGDKAENPNGLKVQLMPHQLEALAWLMWREKQKPAGGVLADDMGLGKTLTMISLILASKQKRIDDDDDDDEDEGDKENGWSQHFKSARIRGGTLIVCPASLLSQWENEIKNRCKHGVLSTKLYHGTNRERSPRQLAKYGAVITTYNILSSEFKTMSTTFKIDWNRVILDEAHVIRNHKSQAATAVCALNATRKWALTGTPIHNKEMDLYSILKFLKCSPFDDIRVWKRWVDNKNIAGRQRLATVMKSLMLRRTKQELQGKGVLNALPYKHIEEVSVKLDPEEQLVYEKVLIFSRSLFAQFLAQRLEKDGAYDTHTNSFSFSSSRLKNTQFTKAQNQLLSMHADVKTHEILVLLLRLRQICCHPALIHGMLDQDDAQETDLMYDNNEDSDLLFKLNNISLCDGDNEENVNEEIGVDTRVRANLLTSKNPVFNPDRPSSKTRAVLQIIEQILEKGDKVIIVSQWAKVLDIIGSCLSEVKNATFDKLTGSVAVKDRQAIISSFNDPDEDPKILLLSLTAGGVGLNLVGANHLLLVDVHWNPQLESQAQDRIYRFGQKKDVYIYKFICKNTIEERVKHLQDKKLELASNVLDGVKTSAAKLTLNDLKSLFSM